jgi:hypothetical protein
MSRERGRQEGVDDSLRPQPIPRDFPHRAGGKGGVPTAGAKTPRYNAECGIASFPLVWACDSP